MKINITFQTSIILMLSLNACTSTQDTTPALEVRHDLPEIYSHVSGTTLITQDLNASVEFYEQYLGYVVLSRKILDTTAGKSVFGLKESDMDINYVTMVPAAFDPANPGFPGLHFAEIDNASSAILDTSPMKRPAFGEIVMAYNVTGLTKIHDKMNKQNVSIVVPLAPSATGRSIALTVLDPNGIRIQMYEYIDE